MNGGTARLLWQASEAGPAGSLRFDCVESETVTSTSQVTSHPVEVGANITDHVREETDSVSLTVFVSNTPTHGDNLVDPTSPRGRIQSAVLDVPKFKRSLFGLSNLIDAGLDALKSALFGPPPPVRAQVLQFDKPFNAAAETWECLKARKAEGRLIEVVTRDWAVDSLAIGMITEPRTNAEGTGGRFTIELKRIRIVETAQTRVPIPAEVRGKSVANAGAQGSKDADGKKSSAALKISDGVGLSKFLGI